MSAKKPPDLLTYATMIEPCFLKHRLQIKWRNGSQHIKWLRGTILLLHIQFNPLTRYAAGTQSAETLLPRRSSGTLLSKGRVPHDTKSRSYAHNTGRAAQRLYRKQPCLTGSSVPPALLSPAHTVPGSASLHQILPY